jgi:cation diffusion facilitator family transporter
MERLKKVRRVLLYTLFLNMAVAMAKVIYGHITDSISMLSDGLHSFFDGTSNVIGLFGVWIAAQPPDRKHPYGHRKYETLFTIAIAILIFIAGVSILRKAYSGLRVAYTVEVTTLSFIIMATTLMINFYVMRYESRKARELKSDFLYADAMHTQTDIYISLSVIISLIAARAGYPVIDVVVSIVIALLIGKMGFSVLKSAADVLTDTARIDPDDIRDVINGINGVRECHEIRTRGKEGAVNIDLHVLVDPDIKTHEAHQIAHTVEESLKREFPSIVDVVVHIEPYSIHHDIHEYKNGRNG